MRRLALVAVLAVLPAPAAADDAAVSRNLDLLLSQTAPDPALGRIGNVAELRRFYGARNGRPAWWRDGAWSPQAKAAITALQTADRDGLEARDYLGSDTAPLPGSNSEPAIARGDALLSAAMMRYIGDVRAGRVTPSTISPEYAVYPDRPDAATVLADGLGAADFGAWLLSLPPADSAYRQLREALAVYRKMAAAGAWPRLPEGPTLRLGATGPEVAVLRRQLSLLGDMPERDNAGANDFDAGLDTAVRRFQRRNGLNADGAVGARTRAALNVTPQEHAATIALNLERLRWFERPAAGRYVIINTAGFELTAIRDGKVAAAMPVIIGTTKRRTPLFRDQITAVTFMPTWTVPPKIAREEILPKVRRDPDYLAKQNMKVYSGWDSNACEVNPLDVDWKSLQAGALAHRFVQQPGPSNALGRVRFTLHNEFGIFLHDTPAKKLFGQEVRAYSHGCVRVGDAAALAAFVFNGDPEWPPAAIAAAMDGDETKTVELREPVPVEMTYLTAWVDESGTVQFRADVYGRDPALRRALSRTGGI